MGVDPNKLQAWAGGGKPPKGGGPKPGKDEMPDEDHDDEHAEQEEDESSGEGRGALIAALEKHADEVEECLDELDAEALDSDEELSDEDHTILQEGYDGLPEDLKQALQKDAAGISREDAMDIADHLHDEDKISDPDRLAGWLHHVGMVV